MGITDDARVLLICEAGDGLLDLGLRYTRGAVVASHRAAVAARRFQLLVSVQSWLNVPGLRPNPLGQPKQPYRDRTTARAAPTADKIRGWNPQDRR
jgi:hypothetical protein